MLNNYPKHPLRLNHKPITQEMLEVLKTYTTNHWIKWLDTPLPALANQTPRQAAKSKLGRERLEALFLHFKITNQDTEEHLRVDINFLKRRSKSFLICRVSRPPENGFRQMRLL